MIASLLNHLMRICNHAAKKTGGRVCGLELLGSAYEGWLDALEKFRRDMGACFRTYSEIRIRGAIWDFIRKSAFWDPRGPAYAVGFDDEVLQIADANRSAAQVLNDEQTRDVLWAATMRLPDEWRRVIQGHYYHGLSMVDMGAMRGVSGSRISQIHGRAIRRLKAVLT